MENQTENQPASKGPKVLLGLLILVTGLAIYLALQNRELKQSLVDCGEATETVTDEKVEVMRNLQDLASEYDSLMGDNDSINTELVAQKEKIDNLLAEAKSNKWSLYKLKKEAATLREIMKGYVRTIDSLNTENVELRAENQVVKSELGVTKDKNKELLETKAELENKVRLGAKLSALNLIVDGLKIRKSNVHKETSKADRAEKLRACFTIDENEVTEQGKKMIYMRIITPEGTVLAEHSDKAHTFNFEGTQGLYSVKKEVFYENKQLDLCMYWDVTKTLSPGEYLIKIYADGLEIGGTSIILK